MRRGEEILKSKLGMRLEEACFWKLALDEKVIRKHNLFFFKFDKWISLTTNDEIAFFERKNEPEENTSWTDKGRLYETKLIKCETEYPEFKQFYGKKFVGYQEFVNTENNENAAVQFFFENETSFSVYSDKNEVEYLILNSTLPENFIKVNE